MKKEHTLLQKLGLLFSKTDTKNFIFETVKTKEGDLQLMDGLYMKDGQPVSGEYTILLEDGSEKKIILKDGVEEVPAVEVAASEDVITEVIPAPADEMKSIMEAIKMLADEIQLIKSKMESSNVAMEAKFNSIFKPKETKENKEEFSKVDNNPFRNPKSEQSFSKVDNNPFRNK